MPFSEEFAALLQHSGIAVDVAQLADPEEIKAGIDGLQNWLESLDPITREATDGVTGQFPVKGGLATLDVNIAPGLSAVLGAADRSEISLDITSA